ncbi:MAG: AarF/ABC1/UbiB kinase family protein [Anaerolineales bacterium]|nr:AarF/ABC1/UbiB kinase family protein [Anaerolineales bacterium]
MDSSHLRARYWRILVFFARAVLQVYFLDIFFARLGLRAWSRRTRSRRYRRIARRFRMLAISMGGVMIKVGQFLSSRLDVLPVEITEELAGLQDEVPAEDFAAIRSLAEAELGASLDEKFAHFDPDPLAAASLGQVHRARLHAGSDEYPFSAVVVKIQRPHIDQLIEVDLKALWRIGGWLEKYRPIRNRVDVRALIGEFSDTIRQEIDYLAEGQNAEAFAANFSEMPRVHVPRVIWGRTTGRVLTLEDVFAIKITDYAAITAAGIERAEVADILFDTYLKQIFVDGFFHADPHPGNLFITPLNEPEDGLSWRLTFVDFGMVGTVPETLRLGLRELLVAVGTRDAERVVRAYQMLGILLPGADLKLIEQAEAAAFERFWGLSMKELRQISHREMVQFANQFRELMYTMPFQVPNDLLMLVRGLAILSGMCTGLNPDFNLWTQLAPYAKKLVAEEVGQNWQAWLDQIGELLKDLIALPAGARRVLARVERGEMEVQVPQVSRQLTSLTGAVNRLTGGVFFAALLVSGVILLDGGQDGLGGLLMGMALLILVWMLFIPGRDRKGK